MITIKMKIGKGMLEFEAATVKEIHKFCAIYGTLPDRCDACGVDDVYLSHKNVRGDEYYTIACKKCGAEMSFHQRKEGGFYIVKGEKMKVYVKPDEEFESTYKETPSQESLPPKQDQSGNDDDIPF